MKTIAFQISVQTIDELVPCLKKITEYFEERKKERMIRPVFKWSPDEVENTSLKNEDWL